jgi:hypothetical protein
MNFYGIIIISELVLDSFTGNGIITNVRDECRTAVIVKGSKPVNMKKKYFKVLYHE